jgi:5-methylthioadenosine/S-adenosylhomocysteine deaminase
MAQFRAETEVMRLRIAKSAFVGTRPPLVLYGRLVVMDAARTVIEDGAVGIVGTDIVHVGPRAAQRPPELVGAAEVETSGTIYPGLIELHNHPAYNAIPLWDAPKTYCNRLEWRNHSPEYVRRVKNPAYLIGKNKLVPDYPRAVARYVECKALLGGHTTIAGLYASDGRVYGGLVRNVEFPNEKGWPVIEPWLEDFATPEAAEQTIAPVLGDMSKMRLFHLSRARTPKRARSSSICAVRTAHGCWRPISLRSTVWACRTVTCRCWRKRAGWCGRRSATSCSMERLRI